MVCSLAVPAFAADDDVAVKVTVVDNKGTALIDSVTVKVAANRANLKKVLDQTESDKGIDFTVKNGKLVQVNEIKTAVEYFETDGWYVTVNGKIVADDLSTVAVAKDDNVVVYWGDTALGTKLALYDTSKIAEGIVTYYYYDANGAKQPLKNATVVITDVENKLVADGKFVTDEKGQIWLAPEYLDAAAKYTVETVDIADSKTKLKDTDKNYGKEKEYFDEFGALNIVITEVNGKTIERLNGEYIQYILDAHNKIVRNYYAMGGRGDLYGSLPDSVKTATLTDEHNKDMVSAMQLDIENTLLLESQRLSTPILKGWLPLQEGFEILADHNADVLYTYLEIMSWDQWGSQNKKTLKLIKTRGLVDMFGEVIAQQQQRAIEIAEKVKVEPTPEGDEKAMFDAIVAPHRGKVVVIQHWHNTYSLEWTNILNMRQWAPLREEFKDDVVWINIFWTYILDIGQAELQCLKSVMLEDSVSRHYVIDATKKNPYRMTRSICDKEAVTRPDFYIVGRDGTVEPIFVPQQAATWRKEYNDGGRPTDKLRKMLREKLNK